MIQTSFIDAPHSGGPTSRAAAEAIQPTAHTLRARVLAYIQSQRDHGAVREEIEYALNMAGNTVRPRVQELIKLGLIWESARTRLTRSGRAAAVLVAK